MGLILGCGGDSVAPSAGPAAHFDIVSGDAQTGVVGVELANALVVKVTDANGLPVKGQVVNFHVVAGGGSMFAGSDASNDSGLVKDRWTLGTIATDSQRVEGRAVDATTGQGLTFGVFRATAVAGTATSIAKSAGDGQTGPAGGNVAAAPAVTVSDTYGNPVSGTSVSFAVASGGGSVTGGTQTSNSAGVATVGNWTLGTAIGANTLTATSTGLTGSPLSFSATASPASPAKLVFVGQPTNVGAVAPISPAVTVAVQDAFGNAVTSATMSITIGIGTPGDPNGQLSGTTTVAAVNGVATFSTLSINKSGTGYTLAASTAGLTGAMSAAFNVIPGDPAKLVFGSQPTNVTAGVPIGPAVTVLVQDAAGNLVTSATTSVTLADFVDPTGHGNDPTGTITVEPVNGVATFSNLRMRATGVGYVLRAFAVPSQFILTEAHSSTFNVVAGPPSKLAFTVQPGVYFFVIAAAIIGVRAGDAMTPAPAVSVQDSIGNVVTSSGLSVTMALGTNTPGGTLFGTTTVLAQNGVAAFSDLSIHKAGSPYTLVASASGVTSATSQQFRVFAAAKPGLAFQVQPTNAQAGQVLSPAVVVQVLDAYGNVFGDDGNPFFGNIVLSIGNNPGGSTLGGTTSKLSGTGPSVSFTNITLSAVGTGYTLVAAASGATSATSAPFDITAILSDLSWSQRHTQAFRTAALER